MMKLCSDVLQRLEGKTLVTAESCTGGGIGAALTAIPGSSSVYKGGVICYNNWVKERILGVDGAVLQLHGPVSGPVAEAMASGVRELLTADVAVSVTGLAGPGGDVYGNEVGTVYIGCDTKSGSAVKCFHFSGDREAVRNQAIQAALQLVLEMTGGTVYEKD